MIRKKPEHNLSHLDQEGVLQASQMMVQQIVEKGMFKGSIPKFNNFNSDPQTTKISFHVGKASDGFRGRLYTCLY